MHAVTFVFEILLAAVFLVAGLAKLSGARGSRQAIIDFGLPAPAATTPGTKMGAN